MVYGTLPEALLDLASALGRVEVPRFRADFWDSQRLVVERSGPCDFTILLENEWT